MRQATEAHRLVATNQVKGKRDHSYIIDYRDVVRRSSPARRVMSEAFAGTICRELGGLDLPVSSIADVEVISASDLG